MNRHRVSAVLLIAAGLGLSACAGPLGDFKPLYATAAGPGLSRIDTRAPGGRIGYILREQADDAFALDRDKPPLYRLNLVLKETRTPRGLRIDNVANRYELLLDVKYVLLDLSTRKVLTSGVLSSNVTYDSADQPYAGIAAHEDGQKRAATDAAQRLRLALASYFADPKQNPDTVNTIDGQVIQTLGARMAPETVEAPGAQPAGDPTSLNYGASAQ